MGQKEIEVGRGVTEWTGRGRRRVKASWAFAISWFYSGFFKEGGKYNSSSSFGLNRIGCFSKFFGVLLHFQAELYIWR